MRERSMEMTSTSTENLAKNDVQVWHTGVGMDCQGGVDGKEEGSAEKGFSKKKKVILLSWDRSRGIIFASFSVAFVIWAAVFFPLIVK